MVRASFVDRNGVRKGAWSVDEDRKLKAHIEIYGHRNWQELPRFAGLSRCGKSCRLRWMNYLRPDVKRGSYSQEEENLIIRLHNEYGKKWSMIAANLPGRTDNEIKNHWHTHLKKRFQRKPTAEERSQEIEKKKILIAPSSSSSFSYSSSSSPSMYKILESSSMSSEATSNSTTPMAEDSLSSLAEYNWCEEFAADIFCSFADFDGLVNLPISHDYDDGVDSVFPENIWGHT